jgi:hypothetical protein
MVGEGRGRWGKGREGGAIHALLIQTEGRVDREEDLGGVSHTHII